MKTWMLVAQLSLSASAFAQSVLFPSGSLTHEGPLVADLAADFQGTAKQLFRNQIAVPGMVEGAESANLQPAQTPLPAAAASAPVSQVDCGKALASKKKSKENAVRCGATGKGRGTGYGGADINAEAARGRQK